ncbi:MAG: tetratricopeptide repeat protein, partial [Thermoanaerobaculia bacterium]
SGNLKMFEGKLKDALEDFRKCLEIFEKERDDFHKALVIRSMLFPLNFKLEFGEAFSLSLEALRIFRDHGAKREMLYLWNNIGLIYLKKHRIERAENIFKILLKKLPSNDPYYALIYHNSLLVKMSKKEYQEILLSIEEFQKMARNADLKVEIGRSYIIEGETYIFLKDFPKAIKSLKKASKFLRGNLFSFDEAYINIGLAKAYFEQKNYEKAFIYLKKAYNFYSSEGFVEEIEQSLSLWEKGIKDRKKNIESLSNTIYSKLFNLYHFGIYYLEST